MTHDLDLRVSRGEALRNLASAIAAAVVNHDHFEVVSDARAFGDPRANHTLDVAFLIMRRQENADSWDAGGAHVGVFDLIANLAVSAAEEQQRPALCGSLGLLDLV